ncbi:hypothetical protein [Streptomyces sp. MJM1172]|uniref:hypothetical protein n=1 Tax=Streptomyces sp. MJM1172 TaxID=1703926 RepID=UPI00093ACBDA|nr:hypothetical protein [Streptomyces sp. MJM1172]OKI71385.1 hypothetical protein AMK15_01795 [Streptomyces sp. MJM1172]
MTHTPRSVAAKDLKAGHRIAWTAIDNVTVSEVIVDTAVNLVLAYYGGPAPAAYTLDEPVGLHWDA